MKQATSALIVTAILIFGATSCKTDAFRDPTAFDSAPLLGMVYDADNRPVSGAQLVIDGEDGPQTGVNGRLVIPDLERGSHTVVATKEGYERLEVELEFLSRTQVLYLRMTSLEHLLTSAEDALEARRYAEARKLLSRAAKLEAGNPMMRYLRAILAYRTEDYEGAERILSQMLDEDLRRPYVYLLLADVQQYGLNDSDAAAASLREFLERRDSEEIRARLSKLSEEQEGSP